METSGRIAGIVFSQNCTKFVHLFIMKIIRIVATRCQILGLKYTKFDFGWGYAPDPTVGTYSAPPDPLAGGEGVSFPTPALASRPFGPRLFHPCLQTLDIY